MTAPVSFFFLAVLLSIATRGSSIQCQSCFALNSNCTGSINLCGPEYDTCWSLVVETKTPTKTQKTIRKRCVNHKQCTPGAIFMDVGNAYQETGNSICCRTDRCNTASLTVPTKNKTLNGLRCPFCSAENYEACKDEVIECRGSETQCFTRTAGGETVITKNSVTTTSHEFTQKGCATESFCANIAEIGSFVSGIRVTLGAQNVECRTASHDARPPEPGDRGTLYSGTRSVFESTWFCLQVFAGLLMTTFISHCLF